MKSIIEQMYYGELNPFENVHAKGIQRDKAYKDFSNAYRNLANGLDEEKNKILEEVIDCHSAIDNLDSMECYCEGFKTGIMLMLEVLYH